MKKTAKDQQINLTRNPKLVMFGSLTEKYIPSHELGCDETYSENDIMNFQVGLLFSITHEN